MPHYPLCSLWLDFPSGFPESISNPPVVVIVDHLSRGNPDYSHHSRGEGNRTANLLFKILKKGSEELHSVGKSFGALGKDIGTARYIDTSHRPDSLGRGTDADRYLVVFFNIFKFSSSFTKDVQGKAIIYIVYD
jgi:hypothetical protein